MSSRQLLLRRVEESERVRDLLADAIRYAGHKKLRIEIGLIEAKQLARLGSISSALERIETERRVPRALPATPLVRADRDAVAVAAVVAELQHPRDRKAQADFLRQVLETRASARKEVNRVVDEGARLASTIGQLERDYPRMRRFTRQVGHIRSELVARLSGGIPDPTAFKEACRRLDLVILTHVERYFRDG